MGKGCVVFLSVSFVAVCANLLLCFFALLFCFVVLLCCFALLICFVVSFVDLLICLLMC